MIHRKCGSKSQPMDSCEQEGIAMGVSPNPAKFDGIESKRGNVIHLPKGKSSLYWHAPEAWNDEGRFFQIPIGRWFLGFPLLLFHRFALTNQLDPCASNAHPLSEKYCGSAFDEECNFVV